jgi:ribosomal protein S18 acetylase RimI-like enzyme
VHIASPAETAGLIKEQRVGPRCACSSVAGVTSGLRAGSSGRSAPRACGSRLWFATGMNRQAVLAAFDEQIRRHPAVQVPGERVERDEAVVRFVGREGGWSGVTWCELAEATADAAIATTTDRFARLGVGEWEWKHYSYDRPADLDQRLLAAGFTAEPAEAVMVAEITEPALDVPPPAGVKLQGVTDRQGVDALVRVHDEVFGGDHSAVGRELLTGLARRPPAVAAVIAVADGSPISAGRVEFHAGSEFASIWGGGTLPAWRGRGVFRSLVAYRAALASAQGFRYLQVDASPESRPILQRLGFVELAVTTAFIHRGAST